VAALEETLMDSSAGTLAASLVETSSEVGEKLILIEERFVEEPLIDLFLRLENKYLENIILYIFN